MLPTFFNRHRLTLGLATCALLVAFIASSLVGSDDATTTEEATPANPNTVSIVTPNSLANGEGFSVLGNVEASNRALVTTEVGGQIANIRVQEGDVVNASTIIATLKNESQQAAVAQAEAALAAAEAGAAQSNVGTESAESTLNQAIQSGRTTVSSSYSTAQRTVLNDIDRFFSNAESGAIGSRIGSGQQVTSLNSQRVTLRETLPAWEILSESSLDTATTVEDALRTSEQYTNEVITLINTLITAVNDESPNSRYSATELRNLQSNLSRSRETLLGTRSSIQNTLSQITSARNSLTQATIGGTTGELSSAQAQINQAQASLRSAQNQLNNTILRAPIAGTVDKVDLTLGQFVPGGTTIAEITNQSALEITAFVSTNDRTRIQVGDEVTIDDSISGTITAIAPAADNASGKIPVTIAASDTSLTIGANVQVSFPNTNPINAVSNNGLKIPITAVRFSGSDAAVMRVDDENKLYAQAVTLGDTVGNVVTIQGGLSSTTPIVRDVRGKQVGDTVTITTD